MVALLVVVVAVMAVGSGDDDAGDGGAAAGGPGPDEVEGVVTFARAEAEGIEVEWAETCDIERGRIAIPSNYAAECVAPWDGDNGGGTSPGVTADSVRVVLYEAPPDPFVDAILAVIEGDDTAEEARATLSGFFEVFEDYYETYGRSVDLIFYEGTGTSLDEVAARADAVTIAEEHDPFLVLGGPLLTDAFSNELAARGIINVSGAASYASDYYQEHAPYLWSVLMTPDQVQTHLAEYIGKRLAGRPAEHAGSEELRGRERVFGRVVLENGPDFEQLSSHFLEELSAYEVEFAADVTYADPITLPTVASQLIAQLKDAGVTSVVFIGDPLAPKTLTEVATEQDFHPEWIIAGSNAIDSTLFARDYDQDQWAHAFGPSGLFARGLPEAGSAYALYEWYHGAPPPADSLVILLFAYASQLHSGIQAAGPELTPETFRDGLFAATPLPGSLTNAAVSWGAGLWVGDDHAALDDMTELWWDPDAVGPDELGNEGAGMYQYVEGGARYLPGEWPDTPPAVFDPTGAVALYEVLPETDVIGRYPPRSNQEE